MKIALLSGADKNAGDFLIVQRAVELLASCIEGCVIEIYRRNEALDPFLDEINKCDCIVLAGGPGYVEDIYPGRFPLVDDLNRLIPPIFALGMGGYGLTSEVVPLAFTSQSKQLLAKIEDAGYGLGCRDALTLSILESSGVNGGILTGCPAWYDVAKATKASFEGIASIADVERIAISDPAVISNIPLAKKLVAYVEDKFENARISFIFHRGWTADAFSDRFTASRQAELRRWLERRGVEAFDIAYSSTGFSVYDECDLHIGFRVHAHIYCLSQRYPTFLVEEDARGYGVDDTLGLPHIALPPLRGIQKANAALAARTRLLAGRLPHGNGQAVIKQLDEAVDHQLRTGFAAYRDAAKTMVDMYGRMTAHIKRIEEK